MDTTSSFGYWIRRQRKALDLTQQALADQVGCSLAAIKKIEQDERRPSRQIAERIAEVLGVPAGQREVFLEVARGLRSVDQLSSVREPIAPSLPTGTVTFLFTDIEDSTKLADQYREAWEGLRQRHHAIVREAIASNQGQVFRVIGDAFCAAFATPSDALKGALMAQQVLQHESWTPTPIQVRMGIHTGEVQTDLTQKQSDPYVGYLTLTRVQRVMSTAYGEQILLSDETAELVRRQLHDGVTLRDMGLHRLKGLANLERLWQVCASGLRLDFPPLPTLSTTPNNLPIQLTSFIGRENELAEVKHLLSNTRLLTFTGPGGTGKTRLALQLAAELLEEYANGVWLVELAPLADPTFVVQTVAATLGVREQPQRSILDALMDYLRSKNLLLILDNCEHLIEACAQLANTLLRAAPRLKILASSREVLDIVGETAYRVPSLPLPDMDVVGLEQLPQNDCMRLFVERASAAYPSFHLKEKNALTVADICRRLDGIPLAIELAAARTRVFSPEEIAMRLDDRFRLLTGGSRTALERHQTLFALIEWSHNLLSEAERALLRRLSVFAGGCSFDAAQAVCCGDGLGDDVLELLTRLVDKSLIIVEQQEGNVRYHFLETIRQYARDRLFESGEAAQVRDRHLDFFLHFAEQAEPKLRSGEQLEWQDRVETEHDNLRTALAWSLESGKSDRALELAGALSSFWHLRGYWSESTRWMEDALALAEREQTGSETRAEMARRAKVLSSLAWFQLVTTFNVKSARQTLEEGLRLWGELGDKRWTAITLATAGLVFQAEGDMQTALARREEGVALAREVGDPWVLAVCLIRLGDSLRGKNMAAARRILEEGVAAARRVGEKGILSEGLSYLGGLYSIEGDIMAAESLEEEALVEARAIGSMIHIFLASFQLVIVSCLQKDPVKAKGYCLKLLALARDTGSPLGFLLALLAFGSAACLGGQARRGVRLLAAVDAVLGQYGTKVHESDPSFMILGQALEKARAQLGSEAFEAAMAEGRAMTMEQAIALAVENEVEAASNFNLT